MAKLTPDICVIGGGPGGVQVALSAASLGASVVLVEKDRVGGVSLHSGSVPARALSAAARAAHAMRASSGFGIAPVEPTVDFSALRRHIAATVQASALNGSVQRLRALGVTVLAAAAHFKDKRTILAGDTEIAAARFVIATGTSPIVRHFPGLDSVEHLTSESVFSLDRMPRRLIVLGGGDSGIELAQAFRRLGSAVSVVEFADTLARWDPELAAVALRRVRAEGVVIREGAKVMGISRHGRYGVRVQIKLAAGTETFDGSHLLVVTGRRPNFEGLGLERAGIIDDGDGISVDDTLVTANSRVYAIGDVIGSRGGAAMARYHADLVVKALVQRQRISEDGRIVPRVLYTDPEIAEVGMTEAEARSAKKLVFRILRWPLAENDRARAERRTDGHLKLIVDRRGKILGAAIVGPGAAEMIEVWALALSRGFGVADMAGHVPAYPTINEIGKFAAVSYLFGAAAGK